MFYSLRVWKLWCAIHPAKIALYFEELLWYSMNKYIYTSAADFREMVLIIHGFPNNISALRVSLHSVDEKQA